MYLYRFNYCEIHK